MRAENVTKISRSHRTQYVFSDLAEQLSAMLLQLPAGLLKDLELPTKILIANPQELPSGERYFSVRSKPLWGV